MFGILHYAHFETKDDLLKAMCTEIFEHVFSEELSAEKTHDFSKYNGSFDQKITHILYHLRDNGKQMNRILSGESAEIFIKYLKGYLYDIFAKHLMDVDNNVPQEYLLNHMVSSFAETIRWWVKEKPEYTPEEIASYYLTVVPEIK